MQYQVPRNVETRYTLWSGFGLFELGLVLIGVVVGILVSFLVGLFSVSFLGRALLFVPFPVVGFLLGQPLVNGLSLIKMLHLYFMWSKKTKMYYYRRPWQ